VPELGPDRVGERIEALLGELRVTAGGRAAGQAEELARLLVQMYGAALGRIVDALDALDPEVVRRLARDPLVGSLLVLHDLHPDDVQTRVAGALDRVRPYLGSHAGGVEYLGLDEDGVVQLRLEGSCDGCPSSLVTVRLAIEAAIEEAAPDVAGIVVEGVTDGHGSRSGLDAPVTFLPSRGRAHGNGGPVPWTRLPAAPPAGAVAGVDVDGLPVLVVAIGEVLYAYRNACPMCSESLSDGALDGRILECGRCRERYDVQLAGRPVSPDGHVLEPLPLIPEADGWKIAVPVGSA
jgi:Fe-S cluster biogenesis protein NfuA/nitrite reductase/ring-hydroxylating ferredoxin subunit